MTSVGKEVTDRSRNILINEESDFRQSGALAGG
jgi:hypothetical protein